MQSINRWFSIALWTFLNTGATGTMTISSAIYMDFDNFLGGMDDGDISRQMLKGLLNSLANNENKPPLEDSRRFLIRRAYLNSTGQNPHSEGADNLGGYHHVLTGAGFEVIDCQNVGRISKSNADVRIAMDIAMQLKGRGAPISEFVIITGDADFAPVLQVIRETGAWVTLITTQSNVSIALTELADHYIDKQMAYQLMLPEFQLAQPKDTDSQKAASKPEDTEEAKNEASKYVKELINEQGVAIPLPSVGVALRHKIGSDFIDDSNWFGYYKLKPFLSDAFKSDIEQGKLRIDGQYIWDPNTHDTPQEFANAPTSNLKEAQDKAIEIAEATVVAAEGGMNLSRLGQKIRNATGSTFISASEWFGHKKLSTFLESASEGRLWCSQHLVHSVGGENKQARMSGETGMRTRYNWTREDDILACYLFKYGEDEIVTLHKLAKYQCCRIGGDLKPEPKDRYNSIKMRIENCRSWATGGAMGLSNVAQQTENVCEECELMSQKEHKAKCEKILACKN